MPRFELVSVVVPALNEAASLRELFARTQAVFAALGQPFEFIVVDDGSVDETPAVLAELRRAHAEVRPRRHFGNHGKSMALMQGFDVARGEVLITMDADLQDRPECIPQFLDKIAEGYDLVCGWRRERRDDPARRIVSRIFNRLCRLIGDSRVHDINCGFKAYRQGLYRVLNLRGDWHRVIPVIAAGRGARITEIPIPHEDRKYGASRYRLFRHRGIFDLILIAADVIRFRPFQVACEMAVLLWALAALLLGGWAILQATAVGHAIFRAALGLAGLWCLFAGTVLPVFGFFLETILAHFQDEDWRRTLLRREGDAF